MKVNEKGQANLNSFKLTTAAAEIVLESINHEDRDDVVEMFLADNQLKYVPETLKLFTNMQVLRLGVNVIEHLPEWIGDLPALRELAINNNFIREIPRSIGNLTNLTTLYCHNNRLSSFPSSMAKLKKLDTLHMYGNWLPLSYLRVSYHDPCDIQVMLFRVALETWKPRARAATITWILIASRYLGVCKDVAMLIGRMVYKSRKEDVWEM